MAKGDELDFKAMQKKFIADIEAVDLETQDLHEVTAALPNCYAKGVLTTKEILLARSFSSDSEDYKEELLDVASWDIWK